MPDHLIVLDHGFVSLLDHMGSDFSIAHDARRNKDEEKTEEDDAKFIRYMMRKRHTSPFEMVVFKFQVRLPIVVARQWIRHRMASYNEFSGRHSVFSEEFYLPPPEQIRTQGTSNKQGSGKPLSLEDALWFISTLDQWSAQGYRFYEQALERGVSKERSRFFIANTVYTEWIWKVDLKNLLDFLRLRTDPTAQWEIQEYARAVLEIIKGYVPIAVAAWEESGRP